MSHHEQTQEPPAPTEAAATDILCPACKAKLPIENGRLPMRCPECQFLLCPRKPHAVNHNFVFTWKKACSLQGRATRREFWGFVSIMGGIGLLLLLVLDVLAYGQLMTFVNDYIIPLPAVPGPIVAVLGCMIIAAMLIWLVVTPLPLFNLTVRRLHDIGRSMFLPVMALILGIPGVLMSASLIFFILTYGAQENSSLSTGTYVLCFGPLVLAVVFSLIILMYSLMDSQRGTNKYGPSVKYPLE